jgi:PEGA domain
MAPLRALLLSLALATALPAALAGEARADDKAEEASAHFKRGVAFYKDKDFPPALVEFKRAYELAPNYIVLFNLGQTARELKDYAAALSAFEQYLRDGGPKISGARRKEVTAAVDELRNKVGKIKITVNVDGAEIGVDDVAVGTSPLAAPLVVNAGRRKVSARSSGYAPLQRVVEVPSTDETPVTLDLVKLTADTPRGEPSPPPTPPAKPGPSIVVWALLGTTGALGIATAITGGLAVSAHGTLKSDLGVFPGNPQAIADAQSKTKSLANATDALIGLTAAAAVATGVFFFVVPRLGEKTQVGVSPTGVMVRGAF